MYLELQKNKRIKSLRINLTKEVKDLYTKNFKIFVERN